MKVKLLISIFLGILPFATLAETNVSQLVQKVQEQENYIKKIETASSLFLGKPYVLEPLGEGSQACYMQKPLYRFDSFDCVTYVNTVLSLSKANSAKDFVNNMKKVGYQNSQVDYLHRNHFTSLDWNLNNSDWLKDITRTIVDKNGKRLAKSSTTVIDKRAWFQHKKVTDLKLPHLSQAEKSKRIEKLHKSVATITPQSVKIDYLPLSTIFDANGHAKPFILSQIPSGAVIEVVRPNWQLKDKIGTNMHVSHLGFAIKLGLNQPLQFRQASLNYKQVVDSDFEAYFKGYLNSKTVKGIAILVPKSG